MAADSYQEAGRGEWGEMAVGQNAQFDFCAI